MSSVPTIAAELRSPAEKTITKRGRSLRKTFLLPAIERAESLRRPFLDEEQKPHSARLRALGIRSHPDDVDLDLSPMARILVAEDGGGVRTFSGNLNHVVGWWPSFKARRLLHFEGVAARSLIILSECEVSTVTMLCEPMTFVVSSTGTSFDYTPDFLVERADGVRVVTEAKADERALRDPEYRRRLGIVAEICRRLGWIFQVVLEDEVFDNRFHQRNCELVASHRFMRVGPSEVSRLARLSEPLTSYGELAKLLDPHSEATGRAIAHALHVRRYIEIDLKHWLQDLTLVRVLDATRKIRPASGHRENALPRPAYA